MATEKPVASEIFPHNGAMLTWRPYPVCKYAITDCWGNVCAFKREIEVARAFARELPGHPAEPPPQPAPIPRSPKAMELPPATYLPTGVPRDERVDFPAPYAPRREMTWAEAYWQKKLASQRVHHDRVYGRRRGRR